MGAPAVGTQTTKKENKVGGEGRRTAPRGPGLMDSLARFGQSLIGAVQTRLQLIADELEEQGTLIARMALLWALAGVCLALAVIVAGVLLVVLFWDSRVAVLSAMLAILVIAGAGAIARARAIERARPRAFAATLSELAGDREALSGRGASRDGADTTP